MELPNLWIAKKNVYYTTSAPANDEELVFGLNPDDSQQSDSDPNLWDTTLFLDSLFTLSLCSCNILQVIISPPPEREGQGPEDSTEYMHMCR